MTADVGKLPLTSLSVGMDFDHVVFTNTVNDVGIMNIRLGKVVAQLKGKVETNKHRNKKGNHSVCSPSLLPHTFF